MTGFRVDRIGSLAARARLLGAVNSVRKRQTLAVRRAALLTEREIKKGLRSGKPGGKRLKKLSPITRLLRAGSKPLIDQGDLLNSITVTVDENRAAAFVGVLRTAKGADGTSMINVALAHEFGTKPFTIIVTPKIRAFFWALHFMSNGVIKPIGIRVPRILHPGVPKRPFFRPTIEKIRPKLQGVLIVTMSENGGPF